MYWCVVIFNACPDVHSCVFCVARCKDLYSCVNILLLMCSPCFDDPIDLKARLARVTQLRFVCDVCMRCVDALICIDDCIDVYWCTAVVHVDVY